MQTSANALVDKLMRSQPSYIRTIKPNENKSPSEYDSKAILHQIKYLGLQENIRVRRAGFAYRNTFEKMVERWVTIIKKNLSISKIHAIIHGTSDSTYYPQQHPTPEIISGKAIQSPAVSKSSKIQA